jgi:hypothetical protein
MDQAAEKYVKGMIFPIHGLIMFKVWSSLEFYPWEIEDFVLSVSFTLSSSI